MYKVVLMGSTCVGKSALAVQFIHNRFEDVYDPVLKHSYHRQIVVDEEPCQLQILDTTGIEHYYSVQNQYMRWGDGFLCIYAVNDSRSLDFANVMWSQIQIFRNTTRLPMVLVANKVDMTTHQVESTLGQELAKSYGAPFVETSAKTRQGVEEAFQELVREIRKMRAEGEPTEPEQASGCGFMQYTVL